MPVSVKTARRCHPVFVDDSQGTKPHIALIVVLTKRKSVMAIEPTEVGDTTFLFVSDCQHSSIFICVADVRISIGDFVEN